jgi:hypothetical protein
MFDQIIALGSKFTPPQGVIDFPYMHNYDKNKNNKKHFYYTTEAYLKYLIRSVVCWTSTTFVQITAAFESK